MLAGMRVQLSEWLTEPGEPVTVRRTWRERLFSRPWHPFVATRTYRPQVPYRGAYELPGGALVMHPATYHTLKQQLAATPEQE